MRTAVFEPDSKLGRSMQRPVDRVAMRRQGLSKEILTQFTRANVRKSAYALNQRLTSPHLITYPQAGHGRITDIPNSPPT